MYANTAQDRHSEWGYGTMEEKLDIKAILEKENMKVEDFRFFLPGIIELLLSKGLIDLTKASDRLYLISVIRQNWSLSLQDLKDAGVGVRLDVEFLDNAIYAVKNDNRAVAIVLISMAIEHIFNYIFTDSSHIKECPRMTHKSHS